jgi:hypothetical protein
MAKKNPNRKRLGLLEMLFALSKRCRRKAADASHIRRESGLHRAVDGRNNRHRPRQQRSRNE